MTGRRMLTAVAALALVAAGALGTATTAGAGAPPSPEDAWVRAAYQDLLGRLPTQGQLATRLAQLEAGRTRASLAHELAHTAEHGAVVADEVYLRVLGRHPDPTGRSYWSQRLASGTPVVTMVAHLYGSGELYARVGGTPGAYVDEVYDTLLGRRADGPGRAYWVGRVTAGDSRYLVARALYLSTEAAGLRANLGYLDLLHRPARVAERSGWAPRLRSLDRLDFDALLVASDEHYDGAGRARSTTSLSGGLASGSGAVISGDGRIVAFTSPADDLAAGSGPGDEVLVLDRLTGRYRTVGRGPASPEDVAISADGSTIAFASASPLLPGDTGGHRDVFVYRLADGSLARVVAGNGDSTQPALDGDGTTLAFTSTATDLPASDGSTTADVYVGTLGASSVTGMERVGSAQMATTAPALSADGTTLAFRSAAEDLGPTTEVGVDTFWARLPLAGNDLVAVSEEADGTELGTEAPSLSADGQVVAFVEGIEDDVPFGAALVTVYLVDDVVTDRVRWSDDEPTGLSLRVADDGGAVLADHVGTSMGSVPVRVGQWYADLQSEPVRVGYDGDLTADGALVVGTAQALSLSSSAAVWLYEVG